MMKTNRMNFMSQLYLRQINGSSVIRGTRWRTPIWRRYLLNIVPKNSALNKIFLGFSTDGNYMFSYTFKTSCNVSGVNLYVFKYKLQIWRFVPGKKLLKICSLKLFPEAHICSELHIRLIQFPNDPYLIMVFALEVQSDQDPSIDEASTETYFSIISLKRYILRNQDFCSKEHNLIANFSMICTMSRDMQLLNCFARFNFNVCTVNSDDLFLSRSAFCTECDQAFNDMPVNASAVLDIEMLLQDTCEMVCKRNNLTFVGFRDYETFVVDILDGRQIVILFGVLIETEEVDFPLLEITFIFSGNLKSPDLAPHRTIVISETKTSLFSVKSSKWSSLKNMHRELLLQQVVANKFFSPYILTNVSVLKRKSLPFILDFDGLIGVVL